jgi:acyl-CoA thioesterase I
MKLRTSVVRAEGRQSAFDIHFALILLAGAVLAFGTISPASVAHADTIRVVALGASNTAGKGVGTERAFPAQLEALLRTNGYDVRVTNAGISGDDTDRMLARVNSVVPDGTRVVILEKAVSNDRQRGIDTAANISAMTNSLRQRHIKVVLIPSMHVWADGHLQADGIHITAEGHASVARKLLALIIAAIRH